MYNNIEHTVMMIDPFYFSTTLENVIHKGFNCLSLSNSLQDLFLSDVQTKWWSERVKKHGSGASEKGTGRVIM